MKRSEIKRRPLADTVLATLEPEEKAYREKDGGGLYFRVKPNGTKSWELRYKKPDGAWSWHGLGGYPALSGARARELLAQKRKLLGSGIDPVAQLRDEKAARTAEAANTFGVMAEEWLQAKIAKARPQDTIAQMRRYLDGDILPVLGEKPLATITRADCAALQARVEQRRAFNVAKKIRVWVSQIFSFAIAHGRCEINPASELLIIAAAQPATKHYAHLLEPELPDFLRALRASPSRSLALTAAWLCLWTASRPGMVRQAEWVEIDFEQALWTIPAAKMKGRIEHVVPLSQQALKALRELHCMTGRHRYLFPGQGPVNAVMSENTISQVFAAIGYKGRLTGHGVRHTASTLLREHGWFKDYVEAQLAHKEQGIAGVYNKAKYLSQRRVLVQWYADYLEALAVGLTEGQRQKFQHRVNKIEGNVVAVSFS